MSNSQIALHCCRSRARTSPRRAREPPLRSGAGAERRLMRRRPGWRARGSERSTAPGFGDPFEIGGRSRAAPLREPKCRFPVRLRQHFQGLGYNLHPAKGATRARVRSPLLLTQRALALAQRRQPSPPRDQTGSRLDAPPTPAPPSGAPTSVGRPAEAKLLTTTKSARRGHRRRKPTIGPRRLQLATLIDP